MGQKLTDSLIQVWEEIPQRPCISSSGCCPGGVESTTRRQAINATETYELLGKLGLILNSVLSDPCSRVSLFFKYV